MLLLLIFYKLGNRGSSRLTVQCPIFKPSLSVPRTWVICQPLIRFWPHSVYHLWPLRVCCSDFTAGRTAPDPQLSASATEWMLRPCLCCLLQGNDRAQQGTGPFLLNTGPLWPSSALGFAIGPAPPLVCGFPNLLLLPSCLPSAVSFPHCGLRPLYLLLSLPLILQGVFLQ